MERRGARPRQGADAASGSRPSSQSSRPPAGHGRKGPHASAEWWAVRGQRLGRWRHRSAGGDGGSGGLTCGDLPSRGVERGQQPAATHASGTRAWRRGVATLRRCHLYSLSGSWRHGVDAPMLGRLELGADRRDVPTDGTSLSVQQTCALGRRTLTAPNTLELRRKQTPRVVPRVCSLPCTLARLEPIFGPGCKSTKTAAALSRLVQRAGCGAGRSARIGAARRASATRRCGSPVALPVLIGRVWAAHTLLGEDDCRSSSASLSAPLSSSPNPSSFGDDAW